MKKHDSMRGWFAWEVYQHMKKDDRIWLLVGDLGYAMWDSVRDDFPDRFVNTGAAEQSLVDIACGLALEGKIPIVYSISTFLLFRAFEQIRLYVNHEKLNVKLIGGGREKDYAHDGISHWIFDTEVQPIMKHVFKNIQYVTPEAKEDIPHIVEIMLKWQKPYFIQLHR